ALLGVLLLRGAQTPGELKQRTERWHSFRSLDDVEAALDQLGQRALVEHLDRRPGQKEARFRTTITEGEPVAVAMAPIAPAPTAAAPEPEPEPVRPRHDRSLGIRNPATGAVLREVAVTEEGEITQKVERARRAQPAWGARPYDERAALVREFRALLAAEAE